MPFDYRWLGVLTRPARWVYRCFVTPSDNDMPDPAAIKRGFGWTIGSKVGHWTVKKIDMKHNVITKFRTYEYPTTIVLETEDAQQNTPGISVVAV